MCLSSVRIQKVDACGLWVGRYADLSLKTEHPQAHLVTAFRRDMFQHNLPAVVHTMLTSDWHVDNELTVSCGHRQMV